MKKNLLLFATLGFLLMGCQEKDNKKIKQEEMGIKKTALSREEISSRSFDELFRRITPEELQENVFTLVGKENTVITAGNPTDYNSMVASFGGWGQLFSKPVTWCFLRSSRYTLEMMRREQRYTMSYFDEDYRDDFMLFGSQSGRDSEKMKESKLTAVLTPLGNTSFKEARLIIECQLTEVTTVAPDDFYGKEGRAFVEDGFKEADDYHKIVFGTITNVWVRK